MHLFLDSFWRAAAYCLHPRVIALSLLPLVLLVAASMGLGYFYWEAAVQWVNGLLQASTVVNSALDWLQDFGAGAFRAVVAPLIVVLVVLPVLVLVSLLVVAVMMTPALVSLIAERRFAALERKRGSSWAMALLWSLGTTLLALLALVVSIPLWLIPPLVLVLPPLIWGWLTYRVMAFDALAEHASAEERKEIFQRHRGWLLAIGVVTGFLGAAPSVVWASGVLFAVAFVILMPVAIWLYTLVFAFSSLWFGHYALTALRNLRAEREKASPAAAGAFLVPETVDEPPLALPPASSM
jgi:hypothetical protein